MTVPRIATLRRYLLNLCIALCCAVLLAACGGGGGGNGGCATLDPSRDPNLPGCPTSTPTTPGTPAGNPGMTLLLTDASGAPTATIAPERPGTLVVLLKDGAGAVVNNALVSFVSTDRTGVFLPASATALTDAKGTASITLPAGGTAGAFSVTASATVGGKLASASVNYSVNLPLANTPRLLLALNDVNGMPLTALTPSSPGSLVATVRAANGAPVANTVVSFTSTDASTTLVPSTGTALTNAQGVAQVALPVGTLAGGFTVTASASVAGTPVSGAISYAVSVPNGAPPAQPAPSLTLALQAPDGAGTLSIAPDSPGTLVATLRNAANAPVANAVVSFVTNDRGGALTPSTGTALTDANGRATVTLNAGSVAAGYTASASASVNGVVVNAATNYAVAFPVLSLSAPVVTPTPLAAGGTASLSTTVLSAGKLYAPAQTISFSSPCAAAGKARIGTPVTSVNGVASTSYTDLGCGAVDAITATLVYNGASLSASANLTVLAPAAGQLVFVSALPQNIALKGTGGAGRQESATVTFRVLDGGGNPVVGQSVNFALNTSAGGLSVTPASAVTGANGVVSTTVQSGTVNTPVRVSASLPGGAISTLSDQLVVSTGVPEQGAFSLSAAIKNVEGGQFNGCPAPAGTLITARLADHFRNPAPDGTAVSFTAEGGTIDASCLTGLTQTTLTDGTVITQKGTPGECTVRFCAGNPRPADGRVTVLAYALGEENFVDANGNNRYDKGETFTDLGDPFRNDRAVTDLNANGGDDAFTSGNAVRVSGEAYIDTNGNGNWDQNGNGVYNGVLQSPGAGGSANTVHVRQALVMVLSNSTPAITYLDQTPVAGVTPTLALPQCVTGSGFVNNTRTFRFAIRDNNPTVFAPNLRSAHPNDATWLFDRPGNPLPAGTRIAFSSSNGVLLGNTVLTVQNTSAADASAWTYAVQMISDAVQDVAFNCSNPVSSGALTITVTTPSGAVTQTSFPVTD